MWGIFRIILLVPHNIVMDLSNIMSTWGLHSVSRKESHDGKHNGSVLWWRAQARAFGHLDVLLLLLRFPTWVLVFMNGVVVEHVGDALLMGILYSNPKWLSSFICSRLPFVCTCKVCPIFVPCLWRWLDMVRCLPLRMCVDVCSFG
jgi:hypothetical protein